MSLNTLSGSDSRDLSVRDPAGRIRVSAWSCQTLSDSPMCYLGITRGRVRTFYLPVLSLYGFTKLYTNPFLIIYLLPNFKLPVLVLICGLEQKKLNPCSHIRRDWFSDGSIHGDGHTSPILYGHRSAHPGHTSDGRACWRADHYPQRWLRRKLSNSTISH
jgi:hypothetical protein